MPKVKMKGVKELLQNLENVGADVEQAKAKAVFATANEIRNSMVRSINQVSAGQSVARSRQGGGTRSHIASKPNDAPNTDTGNLVKSIAIQPLQPQPTMYIGVNAEYGAHLEFGTRSMIKRPFAMPAIQANQDTIKEVLAAEIQKAIQENAR